MSERVKRTETKKRRLRKQPRMRRVQSTQVVQAPKMRVSRSVKRRKLRNDRRISVPLQTLRQILLSTRWISAGILALAIYALVLTGMERDFYLTTIPVEGVTSIPAAEIVEASELAGAHIFSADPGIAAQNIMRVPGVISATVTLQWPNLVTIAVAENKPVARWVEGEQSFWVTTGGALIPARAGNDALVEIASDIPLPEPAPLTAEAEGEAGEMVVPAVNSTEPRADFVPQDVLEGALLLQELRPNIERLYYRPGTGLSYEDGRGWRVYFGTGSDMNQKLVVYEKIVATLLERGLTPMYISVANQEKPSYRTEP